MSFLSCCGLEVPQNPIKPRFLQLFLLFSEVSKWSGLSIKLSCDLWAAKSQEAYVPTENGWALKSLLGIIEVIKLLNHSRTDKCHPLLLQSSVLFTLYTMFNQLDLKFLVNGFFDGTCNSDHFRFSVSEVSPELQVCLIEDHG